MGILDKIRQQPKILEFVTDASKTDDGRVIVPATVLRKEIALFLGEERNPDWRYKDEIRVGEKPEKGEGPRTGGNMHGFGWFRYEVKKRLTRQNKPINRMDLDENYNGMRDEHGRAISRNLKSDALPVQYTYNMISKHIHQMGGTDKSYDVFTRFRDPDIRYDGGKLENEDAAKGAWVAKNESEYKNGEAKITAYVQYDWSPIIDESEALELTGLKTTPAERAKWRAAEVVFFIAHEVKHLKTFEKWVYEFDLGDEKMKTASRNIRKLLNNGTETGWRTLYNEMLSDVFGAMVLIHGTKPGTEQRELANNVIQAISEWRKRRRHEDPAHETSEAINECMRNIHEWENLNLENAEDLLVKYASRAFHRKITQPNQTPWHEHAFSAFTRYAKIGEAEGGIAGTDMAAFSRLLNENDIHAHPTLESLQDADYTAAGMKFANKDLKKYTRQINDITKDLESLDEQIQAKKGTGEEEHLSELKNFLATQQESLKKEHERAANAVASSAIFLKQIDHHTFGFMHLTKNMNMTNKEATDALIHAGIPEDAAEWFAKNAKTFQDELLALKEKTNLSKTDIIADAVILFSQKTNAPTQHKLMKNSTGKTMATQPITDAGKRPQNHS